MLAVNDCKFWSFFFQHKGCQNPHPTITKALTLQGWRHYCLSVWSWVESFSFSPVGFAYLCPGPKLVLLPECLMV